MRSTTQLLLVSLVLTGLLSMTAAGQTAWYYHVKTGGTGGEPVQNEADPGLSSCWNSINAAFAAVKNRTTPGPWIIQVDDEATYDEAVVLSDFETSSTETLTLTKAPWLAGRPTIYPRQLFQRALTINGLWPGAGDPLPDQPGQASRRITYVIVRGFTLKNNASGTDKTTEETVFSDTQAYLTDGLHIIEDCLFDGQNQVYDSRNPILISGTCINTVFRRNVVQDFIINEVSQLFVYGHGNVFTMAKPLANVMGQPQITIADNTFYRNKGLVAMFQGDADNKRFYKLIFERNRLIRNASVRYPTMLIEHNALSNLVQNNIFADNSGMRGTLLVFDASNTMIYHNTFFNNHMQEVDLGGSTTGVEIRNNIFWPTPGCLCIAGGLECTENPVFANNAFFTDYKNEGYPPGFGFCTNEDTKTVGFWKGEAMTTDTCNKASKNNTGNGYTLEGPGVDKTLHLVAGSLCIDRGVSGLVSDDFDGGQRPVGPGCDIGADEYGTTGAARSLGGEHEPQLEGQQSSQDASLHFAAYVGDLAKIESSIREGRNISKLDERGYASLHHAAQNNQRQAIELLIAKGGDVNVKNSRGQTPLFHAIAAGHKDVAELLIAKGAEVNLMNKNGQAPLDLSLSQNRKDIVELLIAEAAIHTAARLGDVDKVRSYLEKGADVNVKDKDGQTALHVAARNKRKDVAELLISRGADLNAKDGDGYTPLSRAIGIKNKDLDLVKLLVTKGADVNYAPKDDYLPLFYAIWEKDQDLVKLLLAKGADVSYTPKDDYPPLHYAVWERDVNTVKLLVDHGAKFDVKDRDGSTALREAASQGARELLQVFITKCVASDGIGHSQIVC